MGNSLSMTTVQEYMAIDDKFVEVVNGELLFHPPHVVFQALIRQELTMNLWKYCDATNLDGEVWFGGVPHILSHDPVTMEVYSARIPDVTFISGVNMRIQNEHYTLDNPFFVPPELAVEVVGPMDSEEMIETKIGDYLRYGVKLVWIIHPQQRVIRVYTPDQPDGHTLQESDTLTGDPVLPGWSSPVKTILDPSL